MIPHAETICALGTRNHAERLRDAAKDRIATGAQTGRRTSPANARTTILAVASWLDGLVTRRHGKQRAQVAGARTSGLAESMGRVV
jgi:hypothetical protein